MNKKMNKKDLERELKYHKTLSKSISNGIGLGMVAGVICYFATEDFESSKNIWEMSSKFLVEMYSLGGLGGMLGINVGHLSNYLSKYEINFHRKKE